MSARFAIALTVKNEWEMLSHLLPYYHRQGAEKIYLFLDGTTDPAREKLAQVPYVQLRESVAVSELHAVPRWIAELDPAQKVDHRKRINTFFAAEKARLAGIGWLASIDADEIVLPAAASGGLGAMLDDVPITVDQVLMPNLELLPMAGASTDNIFVSQTLFLRRQDRLATLWRVLNRLLRPWLSPRCAARMENALYRAANRGAYPPILRNPLNGAPIYRSLFLGYNNHKAFIRTAVAAQFNFNIHKWQRIDRPIRSITLGNILHYDLPSAEYYLKKFRQRPANMQLEVFDTRFQLGEIAREAPPEVARSFYENSLCCPDLRNAEQLVKRKIAVWVPDVANALQNGNKAR